MAPKLKNPPPLIFPKKNVTTNTVGLSMPTQDQGWGTTEDVRAFQSAYGKGLGKDGILGKNTAAAMASPYGNKIVDRLSYNDRPNTVTTSTPAISGTDTTSYTPRRYVTPGGMTGQGTALDKGGYSYPSANIEGLTGTRNPYTKLYDTTGLGGTMDSGMSYAYTDPSGAQQYAMLDAAQLDAINNPIQGSEGLQSSSMFGDITAEGLAKGLGAAAQLGSAYTAYKNYGLSKDKFGFEKAAANRAIANQASEYNTGIQNAGEVGMGLAGNTMDANQRAARQAQLEGQKISTAPIG